MRIYNVSEFNKAAAIFRDAFLPEVIFLRHNANIGNLGSSSDLSELLRFGHIHRHLKALELFRDYLSTKEQTDIDEAWQKYCHHPNKPGTLYFEQYSSKNNTQDSEAILKKLALDRIEDVLKFAKHK